MKNLDYTSLINRTMGLYREGKYQEAYDFITLYGKEVEGNKAQIFNFRYCIACQIKKYDLALQIMKESIIHNGFWYSYEYLMEDDDLKPLHDKPEFQELVKICKARELLAKESAKSEMIVIQPTMYNKDYSYPLIMALHGNQENMIITKKYWSSESLKGYILSFPQSSQIDFSDAYIWTNLEKGGEELIGHYEAITERYKIYEGDIIMGGFSAGARTALYAMLNNKIHAQGFILVGPWLPEVEEWSEMIGTLREKGIKGYIISGSEDEDCYEYSKQFVSLLKENQVDHIFKVVEGLSHEYPYNFQELLDEAIEFIFKSS